MNQIKDMRTQVSTTEITWFDTQRALVEGGQGAKNPIFSGAHGIYNQTIIHESTRVPLAPSNTGVRRAIFCGAQAATVCFGKGSGPNKFTWNEELTNSSFTSRGVSNNCVNSGKPVTIH